MSCARHAATPTRSSATAATSSRCCCPRRGSPARGRWPRRSSTAVRGDRSPARICARQAACSIGMAVYPQDGARSRLDHPRRRPRVLRGKRAGRDRIATAAEGLASGRRVPADGADAARHDRRRPTRRPSLDSAAAPYSPAARAAVVNRLVAGVPARSMTAAIRPRPAKRLRGVALVLGDAQPAVRVLVERGVADGRRRRRSAPRASRCPSAFRRADCRRAAPRRVRGCQGASIGRPSARPA